jgi:predicted dithiol-disulfide oxidoreductase (DUF899 family)
MTPYVLPGESDEYRQRREELLAAERALKDQAERVAALRRELPLGKRMPEYIFQEGPRDLGRDDPAGFTKVRLADLFADGHTTLIVDHLMFGPGDHIAFFNLDDDAPCPMCSMWADGYNAVAPHIEQRASFVLVARAEIGRLRRWARRRGWDRIRLLSAHHNTFVHDLNMETEDGAQLPGVSVFTRAADGAVYHRYSIGADLSNGQGRGIDLLSPVWNLLDLTPAGRGDWYPSHDYLTRPATKPA